LEADFEWRKKWRESETKCPILLEFIPKIWIFINGEIKKISTTTGIAHNPFNRYTAL